MKKRQIKFLAYYLPQFHPIPENDKWWGKGFTEWTNVTKAKPLFKGHYQPILPSELGFYDLRLQEVRLAQAKLAKDYGIDGFIYYQYWFGNGKMLLQTPAEEMLKDKKPDFPFCFCWANETWSSVWHGLDNPDVLIKQTYPGKEDFIQYFNYLIPFFKDPRYIKVDNCPMFHVYRIEEIPDLKLFTQTFNNLAMQNGFNGMYFISTAVSDINLVTAIEDIQGQVGTDVFMRMRKGVPPKISERNFFRRVFRKVNKTLKPLNFLKRKKKPMIFDYSKGVSYLQVDFPNKKYIPCVFPNWDNSARSGVNSLIFKNSDPEAWQENLQLAVQEVAKNPENPPYVIIKSWNEWAEGNYLEPDRRYGRKWLESVKRVKDNLRDV